MEIIIASKKQQKGFTLIELLFALLIGFMLTTGVITSMLFHLKAYGSATSSMTSAQKSNHVTSLLTYGTGDQPGLRQASAASVQVFDYSGDSWIVTYTTTKDGVTTTNQFYYAANGEVILDKNGVIIAENVIASDATYDDDGVLEIAFTVENTSQNKTTEKEYLTRVKFRNP